MQILFWVFIFLFSCLGLFALLAFWLNEVSPDYNEPPETQGDDHIKCIKAALKKDFPKL